MQPYFNRDKKKPFTIPFNVWELLLIVITIIIGYTLQLIDMLVYARYTWLSLAGSCLVILVLAFLLIKLIIKVNNIRYPYE
jgi:hypothetical protein